MTDFNVKLDGVGGRINSGSPFKFTCRGPVSYPNKIEFVWQKRNSSDADWITFETNYSTNGPYWRHVVEIEIVDKNISLEIRCIAKSNGKEVITDSVMVEWVDRVKINITESEWYAYDGGEKDTLNLGDVKLRRLLLSFLNTVPGLSDDVLGLREDIKSHLRISDMMQAIMTSHANRPDTELENDITRPYVLSFVIVREDLEEANQLVWPLIFGLGIIDMGRPLIDNISSHDFTTVLKLIKSITSESSYKGHKINSRTIDQGVDYILKNAPNKIVKFSTVGNADLVDLNDYIYLRKEGPRWFSSEAIEKHIIKPSSRRNHKSIDNILRVDIDSEWAETKELVVTKTQVLHQVGDGLTDLNPHKVVSKVVLSKESPTLLVKDTNLALCNIEFKIQLAKKIEPIPNPSNPPVGQ